jgi:CheY-like chemotaxis protein
VRAVTRRKVLVIDDERLVGEAIARALSEENDVEVVTEAQQALARIAKGERYDIVLCDLMMPVMTGMDLYAEIVRLAPKLVGRIVFMTGGAFTPRARAFLESVVNPCLEKPLDTSKLRSIIARAGKD